MTTLRLRALAVSLSALVLATATACSQHEANRVAETGGLSTAARGPETSVPSGPTNPASAAGDLKEVHSPGTVAIEEQLAPGQCHARVLDSTTGQELPDPACTPGSVDPAVTPANIESTICKSGYTTTVRPPAADTDKVKQQSLLSCGEPSERTTEYDHLVSLELGGANAVSNLWPEPNRTGATSTTNPKDSMENALHEAVCSHRVTLTAAQNAIAHDWTTALKELGLE